jgi:hypothetical protein
MMISLAQTLAIVMAENGGSKKIAQRYTMRATPSRQKLN